MFIYGVFNEIFTIAFLEINNLREENAYLWRRNDELTRQLNYSNDELQLQTASWEILSSDNIKFGVKVKIKI